MYQHPSLENSPSSEHIHGASGIAQDKDVGTIFPIGKIRHNITHHINIRHKNSANETGKVKSRVQNATSLPPGQSRQGNEKMTREYNYRSDAKHEHVNPPNKTTEGTNHDRTTNESGAKHKDHHHQDYPAEDPQQAEADGELGCNCDPAVKKYCCRAKDPFCSCLASQDCDYDDDNAHPHRHSDHCKNGEVPIGSKFYSNGERSRNRNRNHVCKLPTSTLTDSGTQHDGSTRQKKHRGLFKSGGAQGGDNELNSGDKTFHEKPKGHGHHNLHVEQLSQTSLHTTLSQVDRRGQPGPRGAVERQATREALRETTTIYNTQSQRTNETSNCTNCSGRRTKTLLFLIILWLIILTVLSISMYLSGTGTEQSSSLMYGGVQFYCD